MSEDMSKEKKSILLRLPKELHKRIIENLKDESVTDWIIKAITNTLQANQPKPEEAEIPNLDPKVREAANMRLLFLEGRRSYSTVANVKAIKEVWTRTDCIEGLEKQEFGDVTYDDNLLDAMREKVGKEKWEKYITLAQRLNVKQREELFNENDRLQQREECGGNPEERVYKEITRSDIFSAFRIKKAYDIAEIAGSLALDYMTAYKFVVPWMKAQGFAIEAAGKKKKEDEEGSRFTYSLTKLPHGK